MLPLGSILMEERQIGSQKGPFFIPDIARVSFARLLLHARKEHPNNSLVQNTL
jgi:hypothetical protein